MTFLWWFEGQRKWQNKIWKEVSRELTWNEERQGMNKVIDRRVSQNKSSRRKVVSSIFHWMEKKEGERMTAWMPGNIIMTDSLKDVKWLFADLLKWHPATHSSWEERRKDTYIQSKTVISRLSEFWDQEEEEGREESYKNDGQRKRHEMTSQKKVITQGTSLFSVSLLCLSFPVFKLMDRERKEVEGLDTRHYQW